jgi:hypothetical protein
MELPSRAPAFDACLRTGCRLAAVLADFDILAFSVLLFVQQLDPGAGAHGARAASVADQVANTFTAMRLGHVLVPFRLILKKIFL